MARVRKSSLEMLFKGKQLEPYIRSSGLSYSDDEPRLQRYLKDYKGNLETVMAALGIIPQEKLTGGMNTTSVLSYAVNYHWPQITLEQAAESGWKKYAAGNAIQMLRGEMPYGSGQHNIAVVYLDPSRISHGKLYITLLSLRTWEVPGTPIKAKTMIYVLEEGKLKHSPVKALKLYLDTIEEKIAEEIVGLDGDLIVPKKYFFSAPDVGLSLVGSGDALLKVAEAMPSMGTDILRLARRAYELSGLADTRYVHNQLLKTRPLKSYLLT